MVKIMIGEYVLGKHLLNRSTLRHQTPNLDILDEISALLPFTILQSLARLHDMIPSALRRTSEDLPIRKVHQPTEGFRDSLALLLLGVDASQQRNLDQHARNKESSFEQLRVDMHVERKLSLAFSLLLFCRQYLVSLLVNTLSEKFLDPLCSEDILEGLLRLLDETTPESTQAELYDCPVVEDLGGDVGRMDGLLEMRHQKHITSGMEFVVESIMVDMAEHSPCTQERVVRLVQERG